MVADIVVAEIFVADHTDRLMVAHTAADYTSIESMIVVNTQTADNVTDIKTADIAVVDTLKSSRNESWRWRKIAERCWMQFEAIARFV